MKAIEYTAAFRRDLKRCRKRGKDLAKLEAIIDLLRTDAPLPHNAHPHRLSGEWAGFWECHIEGDWLLIYDYDDQVVKVSATGTHQDLFKGY